MAPGPGGILTSPEYTDHNKDILGGVDASFIESLYHNLLGRNAGEDEVAAWAARCRRWAGPGCADLHKRRRLGAPRGQRAESVLSVAYAKLIGQVVQQGVLVTCGGPCVAYSYPKAARRVRRQAPLALRLAVAEELAQAPGRLRHRLQRRGAPIGVRPVARPGPRQQRGASNKRKTKTYKRLNLMGMGLTPPLANIGRSTRPRVG